MSIVETSADDAKNDAAGRFHPNLLGRRTPIALISAIATTVPAIAVIAVLLVLLSKALPAIKYNGVRFLTSTAWNPGNFYANPVVTNGVEHPILAKYGIWPLLAGTLESSIIALIFALPLSVGAAFIVAKKLPPRLRSIAGTFLELLAGIPSVIFGLWGALTLGPLLSKHIYPFFAQHAPNIIFFRLFRGNTGNGEGLLTSALVLGIMVIPIIASTTRDLITAVPRLTEEGAAALGFTEWEITRKVTFPWISAGVIGATVLGFARALGETMAVAMVSGAVLGTVPHTIYSTYSTIAAAIVTQLDSALTDATGLAVETLAEAALILMAVTLLANIAARYLVKRVSSTSLPIGKGL